MKNEPNQPSARGSPATFAGERSVMQTFARLMGLVVAAQGVVGLIAPDAFVSFVRFFQTSPVIYAATVVRIAFGVALVRAANRSRAPIALQALGIVIVLGGVLTPFVGARFAQVIMGWWAEGGAPVVRGWSLASLAIGLFVLYATQMNRRAA